LASWRVELAARYVSFMSNSKFFAFVFSLNMVYLTVALASFSYIFITGFEAVAVFSHSHLSPQFFNFI
jgi:hypothetical protein